RNPRDIRSTASGKRSLNLLNRSCRSTWRYTYGAKPAATPKTMLRMWLGLNNERSPYTATAAIKENNDNKPKDQSCPACLIRREPLSAQGSVRASSSTTVIRTASSFRIVLRLPLREGPLSMLAN